MKKFLFVGFMMCCCFVLYATDLGAEDRPFGPSFEVRLGFQAGQLVDGGQKALFASGLSPSPDSYSRFAPGLEATFYPFELVGLDFETDQFGFISASKQGTTPLRLLDFSQYSLGLLLRFDTSKTFNTKSFIVTGAGVLYSTMKYDNEFIALFPANYTLYDILPGVGFYGKAGCRFYGDNNFFAGGDLEYSYVNSHIDVSQLSFDGSRLGVNFYIGIYF